MRNLTNEEISKFTSRAGVKSIAVSNFLASMSSMEAFEARMNLKADAASYKWNAATVKAISDGISLADGRTSLK